MDCERMAMFGGAAIYYDIRFWLACFERKLVPRLLEMLGRSRKRWSLMRIEWLDKQCGFQGSMLAAAIAGETVSPSVNGRSQVEPVLLPSLYLHNLREVFCDSRSSSFILADRILVERVPETDASRCIFINGMIRRHGLSHAIVYEKESEWIDRGIFLAGNGAFNYYHWMIEILPKLEFINQLGPGFEEYPLLVDADALSIPTIRESLDALKGKRQILTMCHKTRYKVGSLLHISTPNVSPFNVRSKTDIKLFYFLFRKTSVHYVRNEFLNRFVLLNSGLNDHVVGKRLFLARRSPRRIYNQDEAFAVFERAGFVKVYPEDYDLREQVNLFSSAEILVGPSGAAWTNIIFCREGTKAICWVDEILASASTFSNLAHLVGVDLRYVIYRSGLKSACEFYASEYKVDINELASELERILLERAECA